MSWSLGGVVEWAVKSGAEAYLGNEAAESLTNFRQTFLERIARRPPGNHDIERAIRTAQFQAMKASLQAYKDVVEAMPPYELVGSEFDTTIFIETCERHFRRKFTLCLMIKVDQEFIESVRSDVVSDISRSAKGESVGAEAQAVLVDLAKSSFRKASGRDVLPDRFCQILAEGCDPIQSWPDLYGAFLCEQVKSNERFKSILSSVTLDSIAKDVQGLSANRAKLEVELAKAARKQQELLGAVGEALSRNEYGAVSQAELVDLVTKAVSDGTSEILRRLDKPIEQIVRSMFRNLDGRRLEPNIATFHYTKAHDPLVGRDTIIEKIEREFLDAGMDGDAPVPFRWMALCGEGGTGKSRLARQLITRNSNVWFHSGFVEPGFLTKSDKIFEVGGHLDRPVLMVIDYAVSQKTSADLIAFMQAWASYANSPGARPVRIIVITRRDKETLLEELRGKIGEPGRDMSQVTEIGFSPLILGRLSEDEAIALMWERIKLTAETMGALPITMQDSMLIRALDRFDDRRRPLFAAMVAAELQKGTLPDSNSSQESNRLDLFGSYLREQKIGHWLPAVENKDPALAEKATIQHANLVRVATCCGDVEIRLLENRLPEQYRNGQGPFPRLAVDDGEGTILRPLVEVMTGESVKDSPTTSPYDLGPPPKIIPRLEPDLIGERLLLITGDEASAISNLLRPEAVAGLSWLLAPEATATFLRLTTQDYPDRMHALNWLPPAPQNNSPEVWRARAKLLRNICSDIATRYGRADIDATDLTRMFDIMKAFTPEMVELAETDTECREHYGAVLSQVANTGSRLANGAIRYLDPISAVEAERDRSAEQPMASRAFAQDGAGDTAETGRLDAVAVLPMPAVLRDIVVSRLPPLLDHAVPLLAQPGPFTDRAPFLAAVADVLGSVHFRYRDDLNHAGRWPTPRDESSSQVLQDIRDLALRLGAGDIDDICVMAGLMTVLAYAEYASKVDEYSNIYPAIRAALGRTERLEPDGASRICSMLGNALVISKEPGTSLSDAERAHITDTITIILQLAPLLDLKGAPQTQIVRLVTSFSRATFGAVFQGKRTDDQRLGEVIRALADLIAKSLPETPLPSEFLSVLQVQPADLQPAIREALHDIVKRRLLTGAIDVDSFRSSATTNLLGALAAIVFGAPDPHVRLPEADAKSLLAVLDAKVGRKTINAALEAVPVILSAAPDDLVLVPLDLARDHVARQQELEGFDSEDRVASARLAIWGCDLLLGRIDRVQEEITALWEAQQGESATPGRILALWGLALVFDATRVQSDFTDQWSAWLQSAELRSIACNSLSAADLGPEDVNSYNRALIDACMAAARRHIIFGGDAADWKKGTAVMKVSSAAQVERAIAHALAARLKNVTSFTDATADLEVLRSLNVRTRSEAMAEALAHLLTLVPSDDPRRAGLLEESLQAKATTTPSDTTGNAGATGKRTPVAPARYDKTLAPRTTALELDSEPVWHLPPAFVGEWTQVDQVAAEALVNRVRAAFPQAWGQSVAEGVRAIRRMPMICYPDFEAVEVQFYFEKRPRISQFVLLGPEIAFWVTGHSKGLHDLNSKHDKDGKPFLDISTDVKAAEYLRFFCGAVLGDDGPFLILHDAAEMAVYMAPGETYEIPDTAFAGTPILRLDDEKSESAWQIEATVLYSHALFQSTFQIERSGMVKMVADTSLADNLPTLRMDIKGGLRHLLDKDGSPEHA